MEKIEIATTRRNGKTVFNTIAALVLVSLIIPMLKELIMGSFSWWYLLFSVILGIVLFVLIKELIVAFTYKNVKVIAEVSRPGKIKFYCTADNGKIFNESPEILYNKIKRIYILKTKGSKGLITDKSIEYVMVDGGSEKTEKLEILPDLMDATEDDLVKLFLFIQKQNPSISIGY